MPKHLVYIARMTFGGWMRPEIGDFMVEAACRGIYRHDIEDVLHQRYEEFNVDINRNRAVFDALKHKADVIFMVDADAGPPLMDCNGPGTAGFFDAACDFLFSHSGPAAVFAPFGANDGDPMCFRWTSQDKLVATRHGIPNDFKMRRVTSAEMAHLYGSGMIEIADSGLTLAAFSMECFRRTDPPWFWFSQDPLGTKLTGGEDSNCHQKLAAAGVKLYLASDFWCDHWKCVPMPRPIQVRREEIDRRYIETAIAAISTGKFTLRVTDDGSSEIKVRSVRKRENMSAEEAAEYKAGAPVVASAAAPVSSGATVPAGDDPVTTALRSQKLRDVGDAGRS